MLTKRIALLVALASFLTWSGKGQAVGSKSAAPGESAQELVLKGQIQAALKVVLKTPTGATELIKSLLDRADAQVTDRKIPEAQITLTAAYRFLDEYSRDTKNKPIPADPLKGRQLRLQGIQLTDAKEFGKAEPILREALEVSRRTKDQTLEAGVHNNIGNIYLSTNRTEDAYKEFLSARDIAEWQKDMLRAGSYNFNLGLALFQQGKYEPSFMAFKRSAEQNQTVANPIIEARAKFWQAKSLNLVNPAADEPSKLWNEARAIFEKNGDHRNVGRCNRELGVFTAYKADFGKAAMFGELAVTAFKAAGDLESLQDTYHFLVDMYQKVGQKEKVEKYEKLIDPLRKN